MPKSVFQALWKQLFAPCLLQDELDLNHHDYADAPLNSLVTELKVLSLCTTLVLTPGFP